MRFARTDAVSMAVAPLIVTIVAVGSALAWRSIVPRDAGSHWLLVARDSSYAISIDTTRIVRARDRVYDIWYRTDNAGTRYYKEKAFTRETVAVELFCTNFSFKVLQTAFSVGDGRPVARQANSTREIVTQPMHRVDPGSIDADAARATCIVADSRWRGR